VHGMRGAVARINPNDDEWVKLSKPNGHFAGV
jgi:hypothetical protein